MYIEGFFIPNKICFYKTKEKSFYISSHSMNTKRYISSECVLIYQVSFYRLSCGVANVSKKISLSAPRFSKIDVMQQSELATLGLGPAWFGDGRWKDRGPSSLPLLWWIKPRNDYQHFFNCSYENVPRSISWYLLITEMFLVILYPSQTDLKMDFYNHGFHPYFFNYEKDWNGLV